MFQLIILVSAPTNAFQPFRFMHSVAGTPSVGGSLHPTHGIMTRTSTGNIDCGKDIPTEQRMQVLDLKAQSTPGKEFDKSGETAGKRKSMNFAMGQGLNSLQIVCVWLP